MSKKIGTLFIALGVMLIISAAGLFAYNRYEEAMAADMASDVLGALQEEIYLEKKPAEEVIPEKDAAVEENDTEAVDEDISADAPVAIDPIIPDSKMPTLQINGYSYIGYLSIPDLSLELPVMDSWDYSKLKIAPCHYFGSYKTDDLVIAGHNYEKHFGGLKDLDIDSAVYFTDAGGNIHAYKVVAIEILQPSDTLEMIESQFDLTLYTCTYSGSERVTLRCVRM